MGGVEVLGYPASRAFIGRDGCVYQVLQRVTLQACRGHGIRFANTFQILEEAVQDAFLASARQIPRGRADGSRSFDEAVAIRLGWLWDDAIRAAFYNPPLGVGPADPWTANDAINLYGLPMSIPEDYGPFVSQRFQRIAFQRWKVDHPAGIFAAGSVVPVLGGDLLKETGVLSGVVTTPHGSGASLIAALPSVPSFPPAPGQAPPAAATTACEADSYAGTANRRAAGTGRYPNAAGHGGPNSADGHAYTADRYTHTAYRDAAARAALAGGPDLPVGVWVPGPPARYALRSASERHSADAGGRLYLDQAAGRLGPDREAARHLRPAGDELSGRLGQRRLRGWSQGIVEYREVPRLLRGARRSFTGRSVEAR